MVVVIGRCYTSAAGHTALDSGKSLTLPTGGVTGPNLLHPLASIQNLCLADCVCHASPIYLTPLLAKIAAFAGRGRQLEEH